MEIALADEKAFFFPATITPEQARERAWDLKGDAFGTLTKLWARPKSTEVVISYSEMRYEPFWHVICHAHYVYDRPMEYRLPVTSPEVEALTIAGERRLVIRDKGSGYVPLPGIEHCQEEERQEKVVDAQTGDERPQWTHYLEYEAQEIEDLTGFAPEGAFVMPAQTRASSIVREMLGPMLRPIQADQLLEERVEVEQVNLYYRPIYAFEYHWELKDRYAIVELDGLTGEKRAEGKAVRQQLQGIVTKEALFDIGAETANLLVPGGGLAIKLGRVAVGAARSATKPEEKRLLRRG